MNIDVTRLKTGKRRQTPTTTRQDIASNTTRKNHYPWNVSSTIPEIRIQRDMCNLSATAVVKRPPELRSGTAVEGSSPARPAALCRRKPSDHSKRERRYQTRSRKQEKQQRESAKALREVQAKLGQPIIRLKRLTKTTPVLHHWPDPCRSNTCRVTGAPIPPARIARQRRNKPRLKVAAKKTCKSLSAR